MKGKETVNSKNWINPCLGTLSIISLNSLFAKTNPVGGLQFKSQLKVTKYMGNTDLICETERCTI